MKKQNVFVLSIFALFIVITLVMTSCSSNDDANTNSELAATTVGAKATLNSGRALNNVEITRFMINVEDFELEFDDDSNSGDDDDNGNSGDDDDNGNGGSFFNDIELDGPFELEFTADGVVIPFANVDIPVGQYEELEFEITKSNNPASDLFQKSILIEGTIETVPFVFWHNFEEDVEVDFEDLNSDILIVNDGETILINFDLSFLFDTSVIDLSSATDGNGDGIIEISPNDADGNNALANTIKNLIKEGIDLLDD